MIYKFENTSSCDFRYWQERNFHWSSFKIREREREVKEQQDQGKF